MVLGIGAGITRHVTPVNRTRTVKRARDAAPPLGYVLAPYGLLPVVAGLVLYLLRSTEQGPAVQGVYIGSVVLVTLIVIRQIAALRENHDLYSRVAAANQALEATNIALENANDRLHEQATSDPITGGMNHRAIQQFLQDEVELQQRYGRACAVLFLDVDFFKTINDVHGHRTGDLILREFNALVSSAVRAADAVGRWGGEEFLAVLPETDSDAAIAVAERIRECVAAAEFGPANLHVTCSIGVAACPNDGDNADELVSAADHAMYAGKMLGRNQVCAADMPLLSGPRPMTGATGRA
jgi:diguanylate cyclase (GGDEF)-like protein